MPSAVATLGLLMRREEQVTLARSNRWAVPGLLDPTGKKRVTFQPVSGSTQATRELTQAATGPGEHPPAAFRPSDCPSEIEDNAARPAMGQLSNANSLTATEQDDGRYRRPATDQPRDTRHDRRTKQPVTAAAITLKA